MRLLMSHYIVRSSFIYITDICNLIKALDQKKYVPCSDRSLLHKVHLIIFLNVHVSVIIVNEFQSSCEKETQNLIF